MNPGPTVLAQILAGLDHTEWTCAVARFPMVRASRGLSCYDHFVAMVFAQLTHRASLRDIETCLQGRVASAYHLGIRGRVTRTNLAYANEHRDWRVFAEVAAVLMRRARRLLAGGPCELELNSDLFALDATVIELSLALFPTARWQQAQASVKLNVLLDLRTDLPVFASLHEENRHEVAALDEMLGQSEGELIPRLLPERGIVFHGLFVWICAKPVDGPSGPVPHPSLPRFNNFVSAMTISP